MASQIGSAFCEGVQEQSAAMVTSVPGFDPCAVNRAVLDQVARKVS